MHYLQSANKSALLFMGFLWNHILHTITQLKKILLSMLLIDVKKEILSLPHMQETFCLMYVEHISLHFTLLLLSYISYNNVTDNVIDLE